MERISCSLDSYDAIFTSSCGTIKACIKHFYHYKKNRIELERIIIPINKKSKEILFNFVVSIKRWLHKYFDELVNQNSDLGRLNESLDMCNGYLIYLMNKEYITMKLFFGAPEYFLIQPPDKVEEYIRNSKFSGNFRKFYYYFKDYLFNFNYFIFEDQKYISCLPYESYFDQCHLSKLIGPMFLNSLESKELEIACEIVQNLLSYQEFYHLTDNNILNLVIGSQINKKLNLSLNDWNDISKLLLKNDFKHEYLNIFFQEMNLKISGETIHLNDKLTKLRNAEQSSQELGNWDNGIRINQELGLLYYQNKIYKEAEICFMKSIHYHKKFQFTNSLELLIEAYRSSESKIQD